MKVIGETYGARELTLELEAQAGTRRELQIRRNGVASNAVRAEGGRLSGDKLGVQFPAGGGYVSQQVVIRW